MAKVTFNTDPCKGCGLCVTACPKKIVFLDKTILNEKGYHPATLTDKENPHKFLNYNMFSNS